MAVGDGAPIVPAGWYPDPADAARVRRWDGAGWTQDVMFASQGAPVIPPPPAYQQNPFEQAAVQPVRGPAHQQPAAPAYQQPLSQPSHLGVPSPPQSYGAHAAPSPFDAMPATAAPATAAPASAAPGTPASAPIAPQPVQQPPVAPQPVAAPQPVTPPVMQATAPPIVPPTAPPTAQADPPAETPSGPISIPEWAALPGLTLPPDLSVIPGLATDTVLPMPNFANESASPPRASTPPAAPYAPPPSGAQYDAPLPPGASYVPPPGPVLPATSLAGPAAYTPVTPQPPYNSPSIGRAYVADSAMATQGAYVPMDRAPSASLGVTVASGTSTLGVWMIALLPLFQFAIVYAIFGVLETSLMPGIQWAILFAPAILGVVFAAADRKTLVDKGHGDVPTIIAGFIPPLYLILRIVKVGGTSVFALVLWIIFQLAAVAGVYFLMPTVLASVISAS